MATNGGVSGQSWLAMPGGGGGGGQGVCMEVPWGKGGGERLRCRRSRVNPAREPKLQLRASPAQASVQCPAQTLRAESWPEAPVSWASFLPD